jgi:hypothetical protein
MPKKKRRPVIPAFTTASGKLWETRDMEISLSYDHFSLTVSLSAILVTVLIARIARK